jgi:hypothetical protein
MWNGIWWRNKWWLVNTKIIKFISRRFFIPEAKLDEALSLIDRLIFSVKEKVALSILSNIIMELINHQNENWKY